MQIDTHGMGFSDVITFLIYAAVFLYCFIFVYWKGKSRKQKFIERAKQQGNVTTGTKISAKVYQGDASAKSYNARSNTWVVIYGYMVDGVEYKRKVKFDGGLGIPKANYPVQVNVCYDPRRPKKALCVEEVSRVNYEGCLITMILPFVVGHLVYRFLL